MLTELPNYFDKILHFNIKENSFLSALPFLCYWFFANISSFIADFLQMKNYLDTTKTRKLMNSIAFTIPSICLVCIALGNFNKFVIVTLLCLSVGTSGFHFSSFNVNILDIAPNFAGTLGALSSIASNTMGFFAPTIIGKILNDKVTINLLL